MFALFLPLVNAYSIFSNKYFYFLLTSPLAEKMNISSSLLCETVWFHLTCICNMYVAFFSLLTSTLVEKTNINPSLLCKTIWCRFTCMWNMHVVFRRLCFFCCKLQIFIFLCWFFHKQIFILHAVIFEALMPVRWQEKSDARQFRFELISLFE